MVIKWKNNHRRSIWIVVLCAALISTLMCNLYPLFRAKVNTGLKSAKQQRALETASVEVRSFEVDEAFERYLLSSIYYMNYEMTPGMTADEYLTQDYDMARMTAEEDQQIREAAVRLMKNMRNQYTTLQDVKEYSSYGKGVERNFGTDSSLLNVLYDTGNTEKNYYQAGIVISYDSRGIPSVEDSWNMDGSVDDIVRYLQSANMARLMSDNGLNAAEETYTEMNEEYGSTLSEEVDDETAMSNDLLLRAVPLPMIQNATFIFGFQDVYDVMDTMEWTNYWDEREAYRECGYGIAVAAIMMLTAVLALILQNIPALELRKNRLFRLPVEFTFLAGCCGAALTANIIFYEFGVYTISSEFVDNLETLGFGNAAPKVALCSVWLFWLCFVLCWYWFAASVLPYLTHPIRTLKEQSLCVFFFQWLKKRCLQFWHWATDLKLDEKLTWNIWKIVLLNGVIVAALCCIWFGGIIGAIIYSGLLYILLRKKCAEIQDSYQKLLGVTHAIAEGDLNASTEDDMGILNPIRDELTAIQRGFRKAVAEEVRSRNMKTELITNVSHDLKTPLTAIITYVDLLKKEDLTDEERRSYVETLDKKSQRLKVLIEDLFEISKATTDNLTMNFEEVDLVALMKQVRLENEEKIQESKLDFRWNLPEEKCILSLDPQRTFRIMDNLVQNIFKYAMPHSRVYIDLKHAANDVTVSFKNMSATEMNFSAEEITERFVRGDLSRNTEGSGLGLAIAQSFTELQNGTLKVETDGDLFKVTIRFPV